MLKIAQTKAEKDFAASKNIKFHVGDMKRFRQSGKFDACVCMFAAFGYLVDLEDSIAALETIHKHLRHDGLLIFDVWNGLAVITVKPTPRTKTVRAGRTIVTRVASPSIELRRSVCTVNYELVVRNGAESESFSESHQMKYFFPNEIQLLLKASDFELLSLHPFMQRNHSLKTNDWNMTAVARAVP